ncbi:MAG TPA: hypothetical protein DCE42_24085 [Myxococcales bacterium]|nr:hypothetical protein [Deltaproteobacteria bacterium]MBU48122.1 hypothetical protein [Deltaproteobacteria bacterium]HAA57867.1 hypothetical protein [Myxococcales bacterium]|tara:strand:- start:2770 stop:5388 length:2619 start_codon:yes stop_codon:yes gene_type:complete
MSSSSVQHWYLNGEPYPLSPGHEQQRLLDVLREQMGLQGAKRGCDTGECGACTVWVNDTPEHACQLTMGELVGKEIVTLEGLSEEERERYIDVFSRAGTACGFCVPGLVMRLHAQCRENETFPRKTLQRMLGQHTCRCTGYLAWQHVIEELTASQRKGKEKDVYELLDSEGEEKLPRLKTESVRLPEVIDLLSGEATFPDDLQFPNMLYGSLLFTPFTRAHILELDFSIARTIPHVSMILGASDIESPASPFRGHDQLSNRPLVGLLEETMCASDVIALVAAETPEAALAGLANIRVVADPVEPFTNTEYLRQRGDMHVQARHHLTHGQVTTELKDAHFVVSGTWYTPHVEPAFLPLPSCVVVPQKGDILHVYTSHPHPKEVQKEIARHLSLQEEKIEVRRQGRSHTSSYHQQPRLEIYAALMAHRSKRPVKLALNREDAMRFTPKHPPFRMHVSLASDEHGNFTALRVRALLDGGGQSAYIRQMLQNTLLHACGPYRIPSYDLLAEAVTTNNPSTAYYEDTGVTQITFALEGAIELLAERLQIDGWAIRYRNALQPGDTLPNGQQVGSDCSIVPALEAIRETYYRNIDLAGISCAMFGHSSQNVDPHNTRLDLAVDEEGTIFVKLPHKEVDKEFTEALLQIVSQESGLPRNQFHLSVDAQETAPQPPSPAQRILLTGAAREAALLLKGTIEQNESILERTFRGIYPPPSPHHNTSLPQYDAIDYAVQVIVLDPASGRIRRFSAVHDVSRASDPISTLHEIEGAIHRGLGFALTEYHPISEGFPQLTSLSQLGMLPPAHIPHLQIKALTRQSNAKKEKMSGTIGIIAVPAAVAAAIAKREGTRHYHLPMQDTMTALAHRPPTIYPSRHNQKS